ncbi:hypothetical protein UFOVP1037_5 [uncultured Caudovirales phage]|uniref:Tail completion protein n=1 Tax=uncultured Caudovirales phage TaxID=2100421 RepID=A0A6J5RAJ3_9CAUD|nr:hypothetical protein UFOVP287_10 [uncultured Caudovirales phage]CAB4173763.1 hypothetical protein UFOVP969_7 [uncultured Caudovirales phage]CAB4180169.1 hypothetical protein UFOVP1037_5 [uncultured Caudovirales phage]CAB4193989.1 hypothetical protein UFOVP1250_7 [uncultured Caudovirales phage]
MNPTAVRQGLSTALDTITGLRCFDYVPDSLAPPAAVIEPLEITFGVAMANGLDYYKGFVLIIVGRMSDRSSQDRLDAYLASSGASSVVAAIETDRTLGGVCSTLQVTEALPRSVVVSGVEMTAYRFEVDIYG